MFGTFLRILVGIILAYLAAAATTILFSFPPTALQSLAPDERSQVFSLIPRAAVHMAIFSMPLALLVMAVGERRRWRDWAYYAVSAIILSLIGFFSIYLQENPQQGWSIASSNYPLIAFLMSGFVGGIAYWFVSGRFAGGPHAPHRNGGTLHPAERALAAQGQRR
jgi:cell division protein FtsW (lipid II flippase)